MRRVWTIAAMLVAFGLAPVGRPALAQDVVMPEMEPGYPPKMGEVNGTLGKNPVAWETFDFSVGAFDASAWIGERDGSYTVTLMAYPVGKPKVRPGRILIRATYSELPTAGAVPSSIEVVIPERAELAGPRMAATDQPAEMAITAISRDSYAYGQISGKAKARLCPRGGKTGSCRNLVVNFDTQVQYDSIPQD